MSNSLANSRQQEGKRAAKLGIGTSVRNLILIALLFGQTGCASTQDDSVDSSSDSAQPTHDDSHGWGTGVQMGH